MSLRVISEYSEIRDISMVWSLGIIFAVLPFYGYGKYGCESSQNETVSRDLKIACFLEFSDGDW